MVFSKLGVTAVAIDFATKGSTMLVNPGKNHRKTFGKLEKNQETPRETRKTLENLEYTTDYYRYVFYEYTWKIL